jgi:hypothetical protein
VVLKERIETPDMVSGHLELRVHSTSGLTATAAANVKGYGQSQSREDPGLFFIGSAIATCGPINSSTAPPALLTGSVSSPFPSSVRVTLEWAQGGTQAGAAQKITISVDLIVRPA